MSHLKLVGNTLIRYYWDTELREKYDVKKTKSGKHRLKNKQTNNVVAECDTREEIDNYFYRQQTHTNPIQFLSEPLNLSKGVTVGDLYTAITKDLLLRSFIESWFPYFNIKKITENKPELFSITSTANISNEFSVDRFTTCPLSEDIFDIPLVLTNIMEVYKDKQLLFKGEERLTLLEIIQALFGPTRQEVIKITKEGIQAPSNRLVDYLLNPCEIDDDVLFKDLINAVADSEELTLFICLYSFVRNIDKFHQRLNIKVTPSPDDLPMDYLIVEKPIIAHPGYKKSVPYLEWEPTFYGFGPATEDSKAHGWDYEHFGVSCTPMGTLANLPLKIAKECEFISYEKGWIEKFKCKVKVNYTLLQVLHAIYDDISFHGDPDDNDEFIKDMKEKISQIDKDVESGNIQSYKSFDELMDELEKEELDEED